MKEFKYIPKTSADVYDFAFRDIKFNGVDTSENVFSLFLKIRDFADSQFSNSLQSEIFSPNYVWIKHILFEAYKLRLANIDFITKLVEGPGKLSNIFFDVVRILGTPFFTNKKDIGRFIPPDSLKDNKIQPYQLLVFKQVLNIYRGQRKCSLYSFCKTRPDRDITNNLCLTAPWLRAKEEELCPFGQIWKTWGLKDEIPVGTI